MSASQAASQTSSLAGLMLKQATAAAAAVAAAAVAGLPP